VDKDNTSVDQETILVFSLAFIIQPQQLATTQQVSFGSQMTNGYSFFKGKASAAIPQSTKH
jgi:hypothetical protein